MTTLNEWKQAAFHKSVPIASLDDMAKAYWPIVTSISNATEHDYWNFVAGGGKVGSTNDLKKAFISVFLGINACVDDLEYGYWKSLGGP